MAKLVTNHMLDTAGHGEGAGRGFGAEPGQGGARERDGVPAENSAGQRAGGGGGRAAGEADRAAPGCQPGGPLHQRDPRQQVLSSPSTSFISPLRT